MAFHQLQRWMEPSPESVGNNRVFCIYDMTTRHCGQFFFRFKSPLAARVSQTMLADPSCFSQWLHLIEGYIQCPLPFFQHPHMPNIPVHEGFFHPDWDMCIVEFFKHHFISHISSHYLKQYLSSRPLSPSFFFYTTKNFSNICEKVLEEWQKRVFCR